MSSKNKDILTKLREFAPFSIYIHCYGHLLNVTLQKTLSEVKILRNALGVIEEWNYLTSSKEVRNGIPCFKS